jgi:hypothetical protein
MYRQENWNVEELSMQFRSKTRNKFHFTELKSNVFQLSPSKAYLWLRLEICEKVAKFGIFIHGDFYISSRFLENTFFLFL